MSRTHETSVPAEAAREPRVAVLIATHGRPELLATRSLRSVAAQSRRPDLVVLVDDSAPGQRPTNRELVHHFAADLPGTRVEYLENTRTPGPAGAWNTGLLRLFFLEDPRALFVAVLDDDDAWAPDHLEHCLGAAGQRGLDMVVAGLIRHDEATSEGRPQSIPERLLADDFLVGNPHVQGSNLFVRLRTLLEAGLFDEALPSTTDRDLCIRLADLGDVRFGAIARHTVHHYAEPGRERVSSPRSPAKLAGLEGFWRKYGSRMAPEQRQAFFKRGREFFGWEPAPMQVEPSVSEGAERLGEGTPEPTRAPPPELAFVVGIIADAGATARVLPLLKDLLAFSHEPEVAGLDVVLLENGPRPKDAHPLEELTWSMRREGLRCWLVDLEQQRRDAERGIFGFPFERGEGRAEIATARTLLQRYLYSFAHQRIRAVVWILDDDKRLEALVGRSDGQLESARLPLVPRLHRLRELGAHVVLGEDTGAPPLPAASTLRGQLVDLHSNLRWMSRLEPHAPLPDRSAENARTRRHFHDYYYDLSREGGAAETPFWLVPERTGETVMEALRRLASRLPLLLSGEPLFRPLVHDLDEDPVLNATPSVRRGGSTFVFDIEALRDAPNVAPTVNGRATRRSDMLWALLNVHTAGRRILRASLPVRHDRSDLSARGLDLEGFASDLRGGALYCALEELLQSRCEGGGLRDVPCFSEVELERAVNAFTRHLQARTVAAMAGFERIRGVLRGLRALLVSEPSSSACWHSEPGGREVVRAIHSILDTLEVAIHPDRLEALRRELLGTDLTAIRAFFAGLSAVTEAYRSACARSDGMETWLEEQSVQNARTQLERLCALPKDAHLLGWGYEGVVFTAGNRVYKYFAYWKSRASHEKRLFLRGLVGRWRGTRVLYPLLRLHEEGVHAALVYPYEPSTPYEGGHAEGFVRLLQECRQQGIVFRNITPSNLRVTAEGLRLIDYGSDLEPFSEEEFQRMCRRAWLTWRWHHRADLKELLRRSVQDADMPELCGMERLVQAVNAPPALQQLDQLLEAEVLRLGAGRVLDYGCGKGRLAARLAARGLEVFGYDPDAGLASSWERWRGSERLEFTTTPARLGTEPPFPVVLCSLVLCTLEEGPAYHEVLRHLRTLVHDSSGCVLLAVCNPFFVLGGNTPFQERHAPAGVTLEDTFSWEKVVTGSCERRRDVHRPLERLRRDLLRAGLALEALSQTETVDLSRLEPSSDFLVLRLRPLPLGGPRVSLMVKTCVMEWATLEHQVRHLVGQLEGPRVFCERLLVVDSRANGFSRPYAPADASAHEVAVERLLHEGWVDRVVRGPTTHEEVRALNERWFGVSAPATHASNGSQVASTLAGFEACTGEYVLQVDSDVLVCRRDRGWDYLGEPLALFGQDPHALTVALNICQEDAHPFTSSQQGMPWRVEVRAALFHRDRFLAVRPLPNEVSEGALVHSWYRAADQRLLRGPWRSYRGGSTSTFFIHPPNACKRDMGVWMALLDRVEDGWVPEAQRGAVDLVGPVEAWLGPHRGERFVFLIQGRNVPPGRLLRCLDSLLSQRHRDWGAIVVDDGSSPAHAAFLAQVLEDHRDRFTLLRPRLRRGKLANFVWAVRHVVSHPESIIVTLDADDALLGTSVLERLAREYDRGADATVGSMLRTDKHVHYPAVLEDPRSCRGGNVWQHLRTFKKRLFDAVPDDYLRMDGSYVAVANDWAVMLPIIELAEHPVYIPEPLYLHEPSGVGKGPQRERRERIIAGLMARPRLGRTGP
ncbi:glycosyltransferase [Archangium sp.]|uniref:glycosyltransferase n=1 Tax=Archangium sp. TaxID=1872627 RepID=UPI00389AB1C9